MAAAGMVIVGGGECALHGALALRQAGYSGPVTLIGSEHHLPYERPPLSKDVLAASGAPSPKHSVDSSQLADAGIDVRLASVVQKINPDAHSVELLDQTAITYEKLLIATGAAARRLPFAQQPTARILYLRSFEDALNIRRALEPGRRIVIVGGGFIGLEVAASARRRGAVVTVVETLPRLLARVVPEEIAAVVENRHRGAGVTVLCDVSVVQVDESANRVLITLSDQRELVADTLVIGAGAIPCVEIAENAGLHVANGIVVDKHLRASAPDIYAAGDCCSFPLHLYGGRRVRLESWRNAHEQGALAGRNMAGACEALSSVPWFWSDQYNLTLQVAGLVDEGATTIRRSLGADSFLLFHLHSDGRLVAASGIGEGNVVARDIRLAERLIAGGATPSAHSLSSPEVKLKSLLVA